MTTITLIDKDLLNSFVALSLLRTSSLDSVTKIERKVHFKLTFTIKWKLKYKKKKPSKIMMFTHYLLLLELSSFFALFFPLSSLIRKKR